MVNYMTSYFQHPSTRDNTKVSACERAVIAVEELSTARGSDCPPDCTCDLCDDGDDQVTLVRRLTLVPPLPFSALEDPGQRGPGALGQQLVRRIGDNVRKLREGMGITLEEASVRAGRGLAFWKSLEGGTVHLSVVTVACLVRVATVLQADPVDLLDDV